MTQQLLLRTLSLLILLSFSSSAFVPNIYNDIYYGGYPYPDETSPVSHKSSPENPACANAIANANRAITTLIQDLKPQADQPDLYAEFDAVNGVSSGLKTQCKAKYLVLTNVGETGLNATQDKACEMLMEVFVSLLGKRKASSFTGALEGEITIVAKGKRLGKYLGDNCQPILIPRKAKETEVGLAGGVKDLTKSAMTESVEAAKTNLRISANFQKKGMELVFGKDDNGIGEVMPVEIESEEIL